MVLENFAHTLKRCWSAPPVERVLTTRVGDLLSFPMGTITNLVVKYVKGMVPEWHIPHGPWTCARLWSGAARSR